VCYHPLDFFAIENKIMPFLLIQGTFEPVSGIPDGDSVRFNADNDTLFDQLKGEIEFKSGGEVQLRYEGIDALEKAAIRPFSSDVIKRNIEFLGGNRSGLPGYILSSHTDAHGRPVCFVFSGTPPKPDGSMVLLELDWLRESVNYKLLQEGLVYPMFYETLYKELRDEMVSATNTARAAGLEIWSEDRSTEGFQLDIPPNLAKLPPIFPKLWRRLETFYTRGSNRSKGIDEFIESLSRGTDRLFTIPDQRWLKFSTALEFNDNTLRMLYKPEEMVFRSEIT
jgi:endonuclease YncB( thermonuclease family)